jgi:hypothetical protein
MIPIKFGPDWFYLPSIVIDVIAFVVLLAISYYSYKYYKLNKSNKTYLYLAGSFFLICLSFFFKLLTNLTVYYNINKDIQHGVIVSALEAVRSFNILSVLTYSGHVLLHLLGLYFLYSLYQKENSKANIFLVSYLILLSTYLSNLNYQIFHLTALFLTGFIALIYLKKYFETKNTNTKMLHSAFTTIAISHIFFMFIPINRLFFMLGEITQLVGYFVLLLVLMAVVNNGKKKK